jgi:hypothetical protein
MKTRTALRALAPVFAAIGVLSCFPELPDSTLVNNLRVLAVQSDPATANLFAFPLPSVTVTALVVDPADPELVDATHVWSLELPEGADDQAAEQLQRLLPPQPHGPTLVLDFAAGFARDGEDGLPELVEGILPLRYEVETPRDQRSAVKLVHFLLPDLGDDDDSAGDDDDSSSSPWGDDDDSASFPWGDDDDSASFPWGDDDDSASFPWGDDDDSSSAGEPGGSLQVGNQNPEILSITIGELVFSAQAGQLPGINGPLLIGAVPEDGVSLRIEVGDDGELDALDVQVFRTAGCPNLKPEEGERGGLPGGPSSAASDSDPCGDQAGGFAFGGGSDEDEDLSVREFAWRPLPGETSVGVRLFVVLRDEDGGQSWQELRPE